MKLLKLKNIFFKILLSILFTAFFDKTSFSQNDYEVSYQIIAHDGNDYQLDIDIENIETGATYKIVNSWFYQTLFDGAVITSGIQNLPWGNYRFKVNRFYVVNTGWWDDVLEPAIKYSSLNLCNSATPNEWQTISFPLNTRHGENRPEKPFLRYKVTKLNIALKDPCSLPFSLQYNASMPAPPNEGDNQNLNFNLKSLNKSITDIELFKFDRNSTDIINTTSYNYSRNMTFKEYCDYDYISSFYKVNRGGLICQTYTDDYDFFTLLITERDDKFTQLFKRNLNSGAESNYISIGCNLGSSFQAVGAVTTSYRLIPRINSTTNSLRASTAANNDKFTLCENQPFLLNAVAGYFKTNYHWQYRLGISGDWISFPSYLQGNNSVSITKSNIAGYSYGQSIYFRLRLADNDSPFGAVYSDITDPLRFLPTPPSFKPIVIPAKCAPKLGVEPENKTSYIKQIELGKQLKPGEKIVFNGRMTCTQVQGQQTPATCISSTEGDCVIYPNFLVPGTSSTYTFRKASNLNPIDTSNRLMDNVISIETTDAITFYYVADLTGEVNPFEIRPGLVNADAIANVTRSCATTPVENIKGKFPLPATLKMGDDVNFTIKHIDCKDGATGSLNFGQHYIKHPNNNVNTVGTYEPKKYVLYNKDSIPSADNTDTAYSNNTLFNNIAAGTYKLYFITANGCISDTMERTIKQPTAPFLLQKSFEDISSVNANDAVLNIQASGGWNNGTNNYNYIWKKNGIVLPQTTATLSNVDEGMYEVIVTDNDNVPAFLGKMPSKCVLNETFNIAKPSRVKIDSIIEKEFTSCYENIDGAYTLYFSGGKPKASDGDVFSYQVYAMPQRIPITTQNGFGVVNVNDYAALKASVILEKLGIGDYRVVLQYKGALEKDSINFTIHGPSLPKATLEVTNANGFGKDGAIKINLTEGSKPYSAKIIAVSNGAVINTNGFKYTGQALNFTTDANSALQDGLGNHIADEPNNANIENPATYKIEIENRPLKNNVTGCKATIVDVIIKNDSPRINLTYLKYADKNIANGGIGVNITQGKTPYYQVSWIKETQDPLTGTLEDTLYKVNGLNNGVYNQLPSGNYKIRVKDASTFELDTIIYVPEVIHGIISQQSNGIIQCFGANNGILLVNATGGINKAGKQPQLNEYTYQWLKADKVTQLGENKNFIEGLTAGDYYVRIKDAKDSSYLAGPFTITQPDALRLTNQIVKAPSCNNSKDGSIEINITGGVPPYRIEWSNAAIGKIDSNIISNVDTGIVKLTISDVYGEAICAAFTQNFTMRPTSDIQVVNHILTMPTGETTNDGILEIWLEDKGLQPTTTINYTLKNKAGDIKASGNNIGLNSSNQFVITATGLPEGEYSLTINNTSCSITKEFGLVSPSNILVYVDDVNVNQVKCSGKNDASIIPTILKGSNIGAVNISWYKQTNTIKELVSNNTILTNIGAGTYIIEVTGTPTGGTAITKTTNPVVIVDAPQIVIETIKIVDEYCSNNNGSILVNATGGRNNYDFSYNWERLTSRNNGFVYNLNTKQLNGLIGGNKNEFAYYKVVASQKDLGCSHEKVISLQNSYINVQQIIVINPACYDSASGSITIDVKGGGPEGSHRYTLADATGIQIGNEQLTNTFANLKKGTYTIRVKTSNGCAIDTIITIANPPKKAVDLGNDKVLCSGAQYRIVGKFTSDGVETDTIGWKFRWYQMEERITTTNYTRGTLLPNEKTGALLVSSINLTSGTKFVCEATTNKGCVLIDDILLGASDRNISVKFLMSEHAFTNEVVSAINVSTNAPNFNWKLPNNSNNELWDAVPNNYNDPNIITFLFKKEGVYPIRLEASNQAGTCTSTYESLLTVTKSLNPQLDNIIRPTIYNIGYPKVAPNPVVDNVLNLLAEVYVDEVASVQIVGIGSSYYVNLGEWPLIKGVKNKFTKNITGLNVPGHYAVIIETPKERRVLPILKQ